MLEYICTLLIYFIVGCISFTLVKNDSRIKIKIGNLYVSGLLFLCVLILSVFAAFRYIGDYNGVIIGGSDAPNYIEYFKLCLSGVSTFYSKNSEIGFQFFTKLIRSITPYYQVYFLIVYAFLSSAIVLFIKEFRKKFKLHEFTFIMIVIPVIIAFSAFRTQITVALVLYQCILLNRNKRFLPILLLVIGVTIQISSAIYLVFPIFYFVFSKRKLTLKMAVRIAFLGLIIGLAIRLFIPFLSAFDSKYYKYALRSFSGLEYWIDYLKLIFDQVIILFLVVFWQRKKIKNSSKCDVKMNSVLMLACYYDLMVIPICAIVGIWRAPNYFLIVRILMLARFIKEREYSIRVEHKIQYRIIVNLLIVAWFFLYLIRIDNGGSSIIPYHLAFFGV